MRGLARAVLLAAAATAAGCGQKGPPLAPLNLVPAAPTDVSVKRAGEEAHLRFVLPATNLNGPGASVLDRVEIYAVTIAPGAPTPPNRELLSSKFLVGSIAVKPAPVEGEPPPEGAAPDTRPAPGDKAEFTETLTEQKLTPVPFTVAAKDAKGEKGAVATPAEVPTAPPAAVAVPVTPQPGALAPVPALPEPGALAPVPPLPEPPPGTLLPVPALPPAAAAAATPPVREYPVRVYAVRGLTKRGRAGQPSSRVELPIVAPPGPPAALTATATEKSIVLAWTAPPDSATPLTFNVYRADAPGLINTAPVDAVQYDRPGVEFGAEQCFVVRAVRKAGGVDVESEPSPRACITPRDTFAPAAPKGLTVVAGTGTINLSWDANAEPDLGGYIVLRGESPGDTLQPLTPAPIAGTSFEDKTATPGVRYVYAVVAVDKSVPPNTSAQSARVEETAR